MRKIHSKVVYILGSNITFKNKKNYYKRILYTCIMTKLHVDQRKIGLSILFVFAVVEVDKPTRKMSLFWRYMGGNYCFGDQNDVAVYEGVGGGLWGELAW